MTSSIVKFQFGFWNFLIGVILLRMRGRNLKKNSSKKSFFAKLPINKVVFATFLLNQQNAIFCIFYQKIGWTPCNKNMIAAPSGKFFKKKISPNFEIKKKLKLAKFQLSR